MTPSSVAAEPAPPSPDSTNHKGRGGTWALALGAIGVVFGDIGTSPLYALQTVFSINHNTVDPTPQDVYGVISLVFWSITLVVTVKYVLFILRADNDGEGGVLSLAHLTRQHLRRGSKRYTLVMMLGVIGASLFYGDSLITPAISVLSAVEGLKVANPALGDLVLPIGMTIVVALFVLQRFGTAAVGRFFGPIMITWFVVLAALGIPHILAEPAVIGALSPHHAVLFAVDRPFVAFVAMGAVVLVITGAEALYADMGHFGRAPIRRAWFLLVFPCLTLNYLGQGQLILADPEMSTSPFFHLAPESMRIPLVVLATLATVIASQAVISGAFSVSRQAERLGYLPRLTVRYTSDHGGQIYVPVVNWLLFGGVLLLMVTFRESERLATAYGLAVTATLLLTTALFAVYADTALKWSPARVGAFVLVFGSIEAVFFAANLTKITHGGWLPLTIAAIIGTVMLTWWRGRALVTARRSKLEGPLRPLLNTIASKGVTTVPGTAVFLHGNPATAPLALRDNVSFNHVAHEQILIVTTLSRNVPHVGPEDRVMIGARRHKGVAITHLTLNFGFQDSQDVPSALALAHERGVNVDPDTAFYFLSRITLHRSDRPGMSQWRKRIFVALAHNAASPTEYFHLPIDRTVLMGTQVRF